MIVNVRAYNIEWDCSATKARRLPTEDFLNFGVGDFNSEDDLEDWLNEKVGSGLDYCTVGFDWNYVTSVEVYDIDWNKGGPLEVEFTLWYDTVDPVEPVDPDVITALLSGINGTSPQSFGWARA